MDLNLFIYCLIKMMVVNEYFDIIIGTSIYLWKYTTSLIWFFFDQKIFTSKNMITIKIFLVYAYGKNITFNFVALYSNLNGMLFLNLLSNVEVSKSRLKEFYQLICKNRYVNFLVIFFDKMEL